MSAIPAPAIPAPVTNTSGGTNHYNKKKIGIKVVNWLLISVFFSLLPLLLKQLTFINRGMPVSLKNIGSQGEFFLISAALLPVTIFELFSSSKNWLFAKIICFVCCLIPLSIVWFLYGDMSAASISTGHYEWALVMSESVWIFVMIVLTGIGSTMLSEV